MYNATFVNNLTSSLADRITNHALFEISDLSHEPSIQEVDCTVYINVTYFHAEREPNHVSPITRWYSAKRRAFASMVGLT